MRTLGGGGGLETEHSLWFYHPTNVINIKLQRERGGGGVGVMLIFPLFIHPSPIRAEFKEYMYR